MICFRNQHFNENIVYDPVNNVFRSLRFIAVKLIEVFINECSLVIIHGTDDYNLFNVRWHIFSLHQQHRRK